MLRALVLQQRRDPEAGEGPRLSSTSRLRTKSATKNMRRIALDLLHTPAAHCVQQHARKPIKYGVFTGKSFLPPSAPENAAGSATALISKKYRHSCQLIGERRQGVSLVLTMRVLRRVA